MADMLAEHSNDQAPEIGQFAQANVEIEQVTQRSTANAEETASAASELNAQLEALTDLAQGLIAIVGSRR